MTGPSILCDSEIRAFGSASWGAMCNLIVMHWQQLCRSSYEAKPKDAISCLSLTREAPTPSPKIISISGATNEPEN